MTVGIPKAVRNLTAAPRDQDFRVNWDPPDERGEGFLQDAEGNPALVYRVAWETSAQPDHAVAFQVECQTGKALFRFNEYIEIAMDADGNRQYRLGLLVNSDTYTFTVEARLPGRLRGGAHELRQSDRLRQGGPSVPALRPPRPRPTRTTPRCAPRWQWWSMTATKRGRGCAPPGTISPA